MARREFFLLKIPLHTSIRGVLFGKRGRRPATASVWSGGVTTRPGAGQERHGRTRSAWERQGTIRTRNSLALEDACHVRYRQNTIAKPYKRELVRGGRWWRGQRTTKAASKGRRGGRCSGRVPGDKEARPLPHLQPTGGKPPIPPRVPGAVRLIVDGSAR